MLYGKKKSKKQNKWLKEIALTPLVNTVNQTTLNLFQRATAEMIYSLCFY